MTKPCHRLEEIAAIVNELEWSGRIGGGMGVIVCPFCFRTPPQGGFLGGGGHREGCLIAKLKAAVQGENR